MMLPALRDRSRLSRSHPGTNDPMETIGASVYAVSIVPDRNRSRNADGNDQTQYLCAFPGTRGSSLTERVSIGNAHLYSI